MENMAKGCGRADGIEGVDRMPRIVIPTAESKVDSLTKTVYNSTVVSTTYTFAIPVNNLSLSTLLMTNKVHGQSTLNVNYF